VRFLPLATLQPFSFLHLLGAFTLFPLQREAIIIYNEKLIDT
jgi:hypothetical protein